MFSRRLFNQTRILRNFSSIKSKTPKQAWTIGSIGISALIGSMLVPSILAEKKPKDPSPPAAPQKQAAGIKGGVERTFIAVKPDGTQRGLVAKIIERFERKGYKLVALKVKYELMKTIVPKRELAEVHYADLKTRPFFNGLVNYMTSGAAPVRHY